LSKCNTFFLAIHYHWRTSSQTRVFASDRFVVVPVFVVCYYFSLSLLLTDLCVCVQVQV